MSTEDARDKASNKISATAYFLLPLLIKIILILLPTRMKKYAIADLINKIMYSYLLIGRFQAEPDKIK